jgi:glycosyltransferase involved in cell wall biosynthesis
MSKPVRILHVVHRMQRGGIETWLMHVLRNIDRDRFRFDFAVFTDEPCAYDDEIRALNSRIIACIPPERAVAHLRNVQRVLASEGPYDVIHVHGSSAMGATVKIASTVGVPIRIAHSHSAPRNVKRRTRSYFLRVITYYWLMKHMTHGLGVSQAACDHLFGATWRNDKRCQILHLALDWSLYREAIDVSAIREELGIPVDALVLGHIGRFHPQKNHEFLFMVAKRVIARHPNTYLLLVGDGELLPAMQIVAQQQGIDDRVIFTGSRPDVYRLLQAMDVFLLPSHSEGLGLVLLEAQSVGLPCVISDRVGPEAVVLKELVRTLALELSPEYWAEQVLQATACKRREKHDHAWKIISQSQFSIENCVRRLTAIYSSSV